MKKNEGIIYYTKKIKERDLFIKILTENNEILSGMVYAGNSSKKKSIFQSGYFINFILNDKNKNNIPYFNGEITKPFLHPVFNDKYKSYALLTILTLINLSIVQGQKIDNIYLSVKAIIEKIINNRYWISFFCEWLFILLKILGYQIDYKSKKDYNYFDLINNEFTKLELKNTIIFPHNLLNHGNKTNYENVNNIFIIFENIYCKNHLDNINYKMPQVFFKFKEIILKQLK
tara:strand:+ start:278 stop:970 length:693 start_codon:yes stop_codon:yes gene_type:complete